MKKQKSAFTLIELLVVVSIIALLVSILLPSLGAARSAAQKVVCLTHQRGAALAMQTYANGNDDWLAGPNTSGAELTRTNAAPTHDSSTTPAQNVDWISPTMGDDLGLPDNAADRIEAVLDTALLCPANKQNYDYEYIGSLKKITPFKSTGFAAVLGFHVLSSKSYNQGDGYVVDSYLRSYYAEVPSNYRPKITRIGRAAEKVFAIDGSRFVNDVNGGYALSYNPFPCQYQGGNLMIYGPATPLGNSPVTSSGDPSDPYWIDKNGLTHSEISEKYAYRHRGKINAVFFDGHAKTMELEESLDIDYYLPTKSRVLKDVTQDPDDNAGDIIN